MIDKTNLYHKKLNKFWFILEQYQLFNENVRNKLPEYARSFGKLINSLWIKWKFEI